jgi:hypothetical protein
MPYVRERDLPRVKANYAANPEKYVNRKKAEYEASLSLEEMRKLTEKRAQRAEYMRRYNAEHPERKSVADKKYRQKYLDKLRRYDKWRSQTPERKAQKLAAQRKRYREKREEIRNYQREYCRRNKEKRKLVEKIRQERLKKDGTWTLLVRKYGMKHRHGLSMEQYEEMFLSQGGVCAICSEPPTSGFNKRLHVDHDHKTEVRRGLLCMRCNHALERLEKYPDWHEKAIAYLKRAA